MAFIDRANLHRADCRTCIELAREAGLAGGSSGEPVVIFKGDLAELLDVCPSRLSFEIRQDGRAVSFEILVDGRDLDERQTEIATRFISGHPGLESVRKPMRA